MSSNMKKKKKRKCKRRCKDEVVTESNYVTLFSLKQLKNKGQCPKETLELQSVLGITS